MKRRRLPASFCSTPLAAAEPPIDQVGPCHADVPTECCSDDLGAEQHDEIEAADRHWPFNLDSMNAFAEGYARADWSYLDFWTRGPWEPPCDPSPPRLRDFAGYEPQLRLSQDEEQAQLRQVIAMNEAEEARQNFIWGMESRQERLERQRRTTPPRKWWRPRGARSRTPEDKRIRIGSGGG